MNEIREVSYETASSFAKENSMRYIETSAKTGENVNESFETLVPEIYREVTEGKIDLSNRTLGINEGFTMEMTNVADSIIINPVNHMGVKIEQNKKCIC